MSTTTDTPQTASLAAWKKAKRHTITLPSGVSVEIELPDLPGLVKAGQIPNDLLDVAINVARGDKKITKDDIVQQATFYDKLCALTVKNPAVTEEQFASGELPFEDKELIVEIATRQRDLDAVGHHLAGLEKSKDFRTFRGIIGGDEDAIGL